MKLTSLYAKGALALVVLMGGCPPPPFRGGIRMVAFEAPAEDPSDRLGVGGVGDTGSVNSIVGPGHGTAETFIGFTSSNGIDDHPDALDNANWSVRFDFTTSSSPECLSGSQSQFVPPGGAEFDETCLL